MAARGKNLNVVVSREGSLSPRSRSCSASPGRRGNSTFEGQVPQEVNYEDVVLLHRKWKNAKRKVGVLQKEVSILHGCLDKRGRDLSWETSCTTVKTREKCKELQEKMETAKRLLDVSRLESAKLSRVLKAKTRKLNAYRKEAARVPALADRMKRLLEDKSSAERALGEQVQRSEEERRRSTAWRAQVDTLSLQTVQSAERCRALSDENVELKQDLERARGLLKEAKARSAAAGGVADALRLKGIEVGLLTEELGAVREDCSRLVQLVGSTKEYAQFRRLWDESEGLTCLSNGRTASPFYADMGCGSEGPSGIDAACTREQRAVEATGATAPFSGEGMHQLLLRGAGAAIGGKNSAGTRATSWEQAMRSEWSSPAQKILNFAPVAPPLPPPPPRQPSASTIRPPEDLDEATASAGAAAVAPAGSAEENQPGRGDQVSDGPGDRPGRTPTREGWPVGHAVPKMARRVSFSQRSETRCREALTSGKSHRGEGMSEPPIRGHPLPGTFSGEGAEDSVAADRQGKGGDGGHGGEAEVVRWGRVDLLSVVYPPLSVPTAREGSGRESGSHGQRDSGNDSPMWVPREAAGLCRRFVRDFDGYSGVPLDVEQHRLLWRLLLGLNATWRQSERKRVERIRTKYRAELASARRRLDMRKPMEVVVAERAAERRRPPSALPCCSGHAAIVPATHSNTRRPREWGRDGRRVRPGEAGGGCSASDGGVRWRSCSSGVPRGRENSAGRGKTLRAKGRGGKGGGGKVAGRAVPRDNFGCAAEAREWERRASAAVNNGGAVAEAAIAHASSAAASPSWAQDWRKITQAEDRANFPEFWEEGDDSENVGDGENEEFRTSEQAQPVSDLP